MEGGRDTLHDSFAIGTISRITRRCDTHHIGNAQLRAKDSPIDQAGHMSVCPLFVCKFGIVDPYHPVLILLQLGTDGVCLSGVYTPMTVPNWYMSMLNE